MSPPEDPDPGHAAWLEAVDLHALGALDGVERLRVLAHLAEGCALCRVRLARTRALLRRLGPGASDSPLDPVLRARQLERLERRIRRARSHRRSGPRSDPRSDP